MVSKGYVHGPFTSDKGMRERLLFNRPHNEIKDLSRLGATPGFRRFESTSGESPTVVDLVDTGRTDLQAMAGQGKLDTTTRCWQQNPDARCICK